MQKMISFPLPLTAGFLLISLLLGGCGQQDDASPSGARDTQAGGLTLPASSRQYIEVAVVGESGAMQGSLLPGRIAFRPQAVAAIGSPLAARIVSVAVRPGQTVQAGQALMTLQSAEMAAARSSFEQAQARSAAAEDLLRRQIEMVARGVGLEVDRFQAETAAREARAELARAQRALRYVDEGDGDRFTLRAPATGIVLTLRASVGSTVSAGGEALVEIGDPTRLWIVADVPEDDVGGIQVGMNAEVRVPAADARFSARVDGIGRIVDSEQRRLPVYLVPQGRLPSLAPGMQAEVRLTQSRPGALTLPVAAVLIKDGSRRIVMVQRADGQFEARPIRTGLAREGRVTILEGLQAGDKVVVRGALLLDSAAEQLL